MKHIHFFYTYITTMDGWKDVESCYTLLHVKLGIESPPKLNF